MITKMKQRRRQANKPGNPKQHYYSEPQRQRQTQTTRQRLLTFFQIIGNKGDEYDIVNA
jgi:hypothetical protein